ncbi:hypothetical protein BY458DRAFT_501769 [Sporodiniella umbellata]|nr:hypothetical protein BY458DRAFT_501769 [Sporodiniella umbellata]
MEKHEKIINNLDRQFQQVDNAFENNKMRVFGENTSNMFKELDVMRRKQIDLASDHVSLEAIDDIPPIKMSQNADYLANNFEKKKEILKSMMEKVSKQASNIWIVTH